jgi:hypothetical protein
VPSVRPSPVVTADVEAVLVALVQPEGVVSSVAVLFLREARAESWMSWLRVAQVELRAPCEGQPKSWEPCRERQKLVR